MVANQSDIEKGLLTPHDVAGSIAKINSKCQNVPVDYWPCLYITSSYREPSPSMLLGLANKHFVSPGVSTLVGDSLTDKECAERAGVGTFIWASEYFERK